MVFQKVKDISFTGFQVLLVGATLVLAAADGSGVEGELTEAARPVTFDHAYHVKDMEMACADCHAAAAESESAADSNMPTHDECSVCHDMESDDACQTCHADLDILGMAEEPEPELMFDHKSHGAMEELTCQVCHAGLDKTDYAGPDNFPAMETCSACHDGSRADMSCGLCHVRSDNLRPEDHHESWVTGHGSTARIGDESCMICHESSRCEECHQGFRLIKDNFGDFQLRSPHMPSLGGEKGLVENQLQEHGMNFLYLHPIQAKGRALDCAVCHEQAEFCISCHRPGWSSDNKPVWHNNRDGEWGAKARAVGSGGGRHAELARRDIERCAACHDVQGQDPVCLTCHRDEIPGLGNDLKTHDRGWIDDVGEGDWHQTEASICFSCHIDSGNRGVGFCGYCHQ
ncbi:cytochrome c3 family protein [candidate division KSB1 bacterium]